MEVAATEFTRNFSRYREEVQHEPVAIKSHDRITGYFVSTREFQNYQRLKARDGSALAVEELDAATVASLANAKMDKRHDKLNDLLDEKE
jgi:PHD/YefM family antitoxin component YafN of YafNO toxin-antitoxin module